MFIARFSSKRTYFHSRLERMMILNFFQKHKKRLYNIGFIGLGLILILLGGGMLLLYLSMIGFSIYLGYKLRQLVDVIRDWRLAMKINSLQFSKKQFDELVKERDTLREDMKAMNERLKFYSSAVQSTNKGGLRHDNLDSNRVARFGENIEVM